jgi:hypothetical protein
VFYRDAARELLRIVGMLGKVETHEQAQVWMRAFIEWHNRREEFINQKSGRWWYTHKMLHRSDSHIRRALPEMFAYTRHTRVPKSSISSEAFFGHLKDNLRIHRGLSAQHFWDFVKWYLFFQSNQRKITKYQGEKN